MYPSAENGKVLPSLVRQISSLASSLRRTIGSHAPTRWALEALSEMPEGVIVTDPEGRVVLMNAMAESLTATREGDAIGRLVENILHLQTGSGFTAESPLRRAMRLGGAVDGGPSMAIVDSAGRARWLAATGLPLHGPGGQICGAMLLIRDGTARRETDEALRRAAEFEQFFARAEFGMHRLSPDGTILSANAAELEITGWSPPRYIGHNIVEFFEDPMEARLVLERLQSGERVRDAEVRLRCADGRLRPVLLDETGVWQDGRLSAIQGMMRDDSQRRRSQAELEWARARADAADKARDRFLAVLSHELRTPLTPVVLAIGELERMPRLPATARTHLAVIRRNVELEARLIDDLLELTHIHRGPMELHTREVDVHGLIANALEFSRADVETKELVVDMRLDAARHTVVGDEARLQQVFWNLLHNAVKFTPPGGRIEIRTSNPEGRLRIDVEDSGVGIPTQEMDRIFDAFSRGEAGRPFGGLGVGLSIARALVEVHGGSISALSGGTGEGALFTVELPGPMSQPAGPRALRMAPRAIRILVVEDHADTAHMLEQLLTRMHYTVRTASTVAEALSAANEDTFDLLVSDIGLPDGTGLELMKAIDGHRPPHGIALSGYGLEADAEESRAVGFDVHLTKPVDIERLLEEIRRLTE